MHSQRLRFGLQGIARNCVFSHRRHPTLCLQAAKTAYNLHAVSLAFQVKDYAGLSAPAIARGATCRFKTLPEDVVAPTITGTDTLLAGVETQQYTILSRFMAVFGQRLQDH